MNEVETIEYQKPRFFVKCVKHADGTVLQIIRIPCTKIERCSDAVKTLEKMGFRCGVEEGVMVL